MATGFKGRVWELGRTTFCTSDLPTPNPKPSGGTVVPYRGRFLVAHHVLAAERDASGLNVELASKT